MIRLWKDNRTSWSFFAWQSITKVIPKVVILGITECAEHIVSKIPPFYAGVIRAFAYINCLDVSVSKQSNIWTTTSSPKVSQMLVDVGYIEVGDLPVVNGVLDCRSVQM